MLTTAMAMLLALCAPEGGDAPPPRPHVQFEAASSVSSIAAGVPFDVVCTLTVPPKWHIYWKDPGSSGMATRVRVSGAKDFKVGPVRFPCPVTLLDPAGAVNSLDGRVHLAVSITPPETLEPGREALIQVDADWLVCREACFLGGGNVAVRIPITATPGPETEAAAWIRGLPRPIEQRAGTSVAVVPGPLLRISGPRDPAGEPNFVQEHRPGVAIGTPTISTAGDTFVMNIPMAYDSRESLGQPPRIQGLVRFGSGRGTSEGTSAWEIDLPFDSNGTQERKPAP
jgi:DsbC/DsbD-like thiol-disulfide interchange protein